MEKSIKFTASEAAQRRAIERRIQKVLDQLEEEEIYDCVKTFMENNVDYLDGVGSSIMKVEPLIRSIQAIESNYKKYAEKMTYFSKQCDEIDKRKIDAITKSMDQLFKETKKKGR